MQQLSGLDLLNFINATRMDCTGLVHYVADDPQLIESVSPTLPLFVVYDWLEDSIDTSVWIYIFDICSVDQWDVERLAEKLSQTFVIVTFTAIDELDGHVEIQEDRQNDGHDLPGDVERARQITPPGTARAQINARGEIVEPVVELGVELGVDVDNELLGPLQSTAFPGQVSQIVSLLADSSRVLFQNCPGILLSHIDLSGTMITFGNSVTNVIVSCCWASSYFEIIGDAVESFRIVDCHLSLFEHICIDDLRCDVIHILGDLISLSRKKFLGYELVIDNLFEMKECELGGNYILLAFCDGRLGKAASMVDCSLQDTDDLCISFQTMFPLISGCDFSGLSTIALNPDEIDLLFFGEQQLIDYSFLKGVPTVKLANFTDPLLKCAPLDEMRTLELGFDQNLNCPLNLGFANLQTLGITLGGAATRIPNLQNTENITGLCIDHISFQQLEEWTLLRCFERLKRLDTFYFKDCNRESSADISEALWDISPQLKTVALRDVDGEFFSGVGIKAFPNIESFYYYNAWQGGDTFRLNLRGLKYLRHVILELPLREVKVCKGNSPHLERIRIESSKYHQDVLYC